MTDDKADELIQAINNNSTKINTLSNDIDALYDLIKKIDFNNEAKSVKNKLDEIINALGQ